MEKLQDKVENKSFNVSIKDIKWIVGIGVVVIGWGITGVLWFKENGDLKGTVKSLKEENVSLVIKVSKLEGQIDGVNAATKVFLENPPEVLNFKIKELRTDVTDIQSRLHISSNSNNADTTVVITRAIH